MSTPAQAPSLPPDLARAAAGTVVEGQVRNVSADGQVSVRTAHGEVRLELTRAQVAQLLRPGTPVAIEIRNPTAQPPVVQLTVRPASSGGAPQPAAPPVQPAVTTGSAAAPPTVPLTVGRIVQATVVPGPSASGQPAAPAAAPSAAGGQPPVPGTAAPTGQASSGPAVTGQAPTAQAPTAQAPTGQAPVASPTAAQPAPPAGATPPTPGAAQTPVAQTTAAPTPATQTPATQTPAAPPAAGPATTRLPVQGNPPQPSAPQPGTPPAAAAGQGATGSRPGGVPAPLPATTSPASPTPPMAGGTDARQQAAPASSASAASASAPPAAATGSGRTQLPNGAVLTVRVAAVAEAAARPEGAARAVTGLVQETGTPTRIAGQIAGLTAAGRPVVQSPVGYLALDARADLRLGTPIALDVLASRTAGWTTPSSPLPVLAREWPALETALRVMEEQLGPAAARQAIEGMPRPGPQLTATMLFFMAALRGGDVRAWLGRNATQALETSGRGALLGSLSDDFQTLQRASEPSESGWRSFLIPIAWDERRPIRLLTRRERRDGRDGRGGKPGTAFLVDIDLTNLGPFRLDGLVREELLDLLIRTIKPLPAVMRQDIKALFDGTLERTGIVGRLSFKASPVMPPLPVDLEAGPAGGTTTLTV